ncbi:hypothetical protein JCM10207_005017 [Rhodosporidiobolus poonsookiae]
MSTNAQQRSLYRSFLRGLSRSLRSSRPYFVNLRRLYRPQLREALMASGGDMEQLRQQVERTLFLLESSPRLRKNLSSLSYHHTPYHLPHTSNAARLSHLPRPISWDPQNPEAAVKAADKRAKDAAKDPVQRIALGVDAGLQRLWVDAEKAAGGVLLGRITTRAHGDT